MSKDTTSAGEWRTFVSTVWQNTSSPPADASENSVKVIFGSLYCAQAFLTAAGNGLVLFVMCRARLYRQTPSAGLAINIAVSDILLAAALLLHAFLLLDPVSTRASEWCMAHALFMSFASLGVQLSLMLVVVERYVAILHPYRYVSVVKPRNVLAAVAVMWVYSLLLILVSLHPVFNHLNTTPLCLAGDVLDRKYVLLLVGHYLLITVVSLAANLSITAIACRQNAKVRAAIKVGVVTSPSPRPLPSTGSSRRQGGDSSSLTHGNRDVSSCPCSTSQCADDSVFLRNDDNTQRWRVVENEMGLVISPNPCLSSERPAVNSSGEKGKVIKMGVVTSPTSPRPLPSTNFSRRQGVDSSHGRRDVSSSPCSTSQCADDSVFLRSNDDNTQRWCVVENEMGLVIPPNPCLSSERPAVNSSGETGNVVTPPSPGPLPSTNFSRRQGEDSSHGRRDVSSCPCATSQSADDSVFLRNDDNTQQWCVVENEMGLVIPPNPCKCSERQGVDSSDGKRHVSSCSSSSQGDALPQSEGPTEYFQCYRGGGGVHLTKEEEEEQQQHGVDRSDEKIAVSSGPFSGQKPERCVFLRGDNTQKRCVVENKVGVVVLSTHCPSSERQGIEGSVENYVVCSCPCSNQGASDFVSHRVADKPGGIETPPHRHRPERDSTYEAASVMRSTPFSNPSERPSESPECDASVVGNPSEQPSEGFIDRDVGWRNAALAVDNSFGHPQEGRIDGYVGQRNAALAVSNPSEHPIEGPVGGFVRQRNAALAVINLSHHPSEGPLDGFVGQRNAALAVNNAPQVPVDELVGRNTALAVSNLTHHPSEVPLDGYVCQRNAALAANTPSEHPSEGPIDGSVGQKNPTLAVSNPSEHPSESPIDGFVGPRTAVLAVINPSHHPPEGPVEGFVGPRTVALAVINPSHHPSEGPVDGFVGRNAALAVSNPSDLPSEVPVDEYIGQRNAALAVNNPLAVNTHTEHASEGAIGGYVSQKNPALAVCNPSEHISEGPVDGFVGLRTSALAVLTSSHHPSAEGLIYGDGDRINDASPAAGASLQPPEGISIDGNVFLQQSSETVAASQRPRNKLRKLLGTNRHVFSFDEEDIERHRTSMTLSPVSSLQFVPPGQFISPESNLQPGLYGQFLSPEPSLEFVPPRELLSPAESSLQPDPSGQNQKSQSQGEPIHGSICLLKENVIPSPQSQVEDFNDSNCPIKDNAMPIPTSTGERCHNSSCLLKDNVTHRPQSPGELCHNSSCLTQKDVIHRTHSLRQLFKYDNTHGNDKAGLILKPQSSGEHLHANCCHINVDTIHQLHYHEHFKESSYHVKEEIIQSPHSSRKPFHYGITLGKDRPTKDLILKPRYLEEHLYTTRCHIKGEEVPQPQHQGEYVHDSICLIQENVIPRLQSLEEHCRNNSRVLKCLGQHIQQTPTHYLCSQCCQLYPDSQQTPTNCFSPQHYRLSPDSQQTPTNCFCLQHCLLSLDPQQTAMQCVCGQRCQLSPNFQSSPAHSLCCQRCQQAQRGWLEEEEEEKETVLSGGGTRSANPDLERTDDPPLARSEAGGMISIKALCILPLVHKAPEQGSSSQDEGAPSTAAAGTTAASTPESVYASYSQHIRGGEGGEGGERGEGGGGEREEEEGGEGGEGEEGGEGRERGEGEGGKEEEGAGGGERVENPETQFLTVPSTSGQCPRSSPRPRSSHDRPSSSKEETLGRTIAGVEGQKPKLLTVPLSSGQCPQQCRPSQPTNDRSSKECFGRIGREGGAGGVERVGEGKGREGPEPKFLMVPSISVRRPGPCCRPESTYDRSDNRRKEGLGRVSRGEGGAGEIGDGEGGRGGEGPESQFLTVPSTPGLCPRPCHRSEPTHDPSANNNILEEGSGRISRGGEAGGRGEGGGGEGPEPQFLTVPSTPGLCPRPCHRSEPTHDPSANNNILEEGSGRISRGGEARGRGEGGGGEEPETQFLTVPPGPCLRPCHRSEPTHDPSGNHNSLEEGFLRTSKSSPLPTEQPPGKSSQSSSSVRSSSSSSSSSQTKRTLWSSSESRISIRSSIRSSLRSSIRSSLRSSIRSSSRPTSLQVSASLKRTFRLLQHSGLLALLFSLSWSPFVVVELLELSGAPQPVAVRRLVAMFIFLTPVTNPIIYVWGNQRFRRAFLRLFARSRLARVGPMAEMTATAAPSIRLTTDRTSTVCHGSYT